MLVVVVVVVVVVSEEIFEKPSISLSIFKLIVLKALKKILSNLPFLSVVISPFGGVVDEKLIVVGNAVVDVLIVVVVVPVVPVVLVVESVVVCVVGLPVMVVFVVVDDVVPSFLSNKSK